MNNRYGVVHQTEMIVVPRQDVILDRSGTDHRVYIKVRSLEAVEKIIEQCKVIKNEFKKAEKAVANTK